MAPDMQAVASAAEDYAAGVNLPQSWREVEEWARTVNLPGATWAADFLRSTGADVMAERWGRAVETGALPTVGEWGDAAAIPIEMAIGLLSDLITPAEGIEELVGPMDVETEKARRQLAALQKYPELGRPGDPGGVARIRALQEIVGEPELEPALIRNVRAEATAKHGDTEEVHRAITWSYTMAYSGAEAQLEAVDRIMAGEDPYVVAEWGHTTLDSGRAIATAMDDEDPRIRAQGLQAVERYIASDEYARAHHKYRTEVLGESHEVACKVIAQSGGVPTSQNMALEIAGRIVFDPLTYTGLGILDAFRARHVAQFVAPGATETAEVLIRGKRAPILFDKVFGLTPAARSSEAMRIGHDFIGWALRRGDEAGESVGKMTWLLKRAGQGSDEAIEALAKIDPALGEILTSRMGKVGAYVFNAASEVPGQIRLIKGADGLDEFLARGARAINDLVGVKPQNKFMRGIGWVKGKIATYLHLGYNPAWVARNILSDTSIAVFDRSYTLVGDAEIARHLDSLGIKPAAAVKGGPGMAGEFIRVEKGLPIAEGALNKALLKAGVPEGTATAVSKVVRQYGTDAVLGQAGDAVRLYGKGADDALDVLAKSTKKGWFETLTTGPMLDVAAKSEVFTGKRVLYTTSKRYFDDTMGAWLKKNAPELSDEAMALIGAGRIDLVPPSLAGDFAKTRAITSLTAGEVGTMARNWTLHNYDARRGFDAAMGVVFNYPFWTSRTASKWVVRAIDDPGMLGTAVSLIKAVHQHNAGLSDYEKGYVQIGDALGRHISVPMLALAIPYYQMYETYNDPNITELPFGEYYNTINNLSSPNQLITWGLGAYYLLSDDEDAQRVGRKMLAPGRQAKWLDVAIAGAAARGVVQDVYTWSPRENRLVRIQLAQMEASGEIAHEEAMIAIRDQNDLWNDAVERAAGAALLPAIAGWLITTPRVKDVVWEAEVSELYMVIGNLMAQRDAGTISLDQFNAGWDLINGKYPWSAVLFEKPLDDVAKVQAIQQSLYYYEKDKLDEQYRQDRDAIIRETPHAKQELIALREGYDEATESLRQKWGQFPEETPVGEIGPPKDKYFPEDRLRQQVYASVRDALPRVEDYTDEDGNPDWDAYNAAREGFWASVSEQVDVGAIAEAYGVDEEAVASLLTEEGANAYWRRNDSVPQAVHKVWEDEVHGPAWANYHAAVDGGMDKNEAYKKYILSVGGMTATSLLDKIQAAYPKRWSDAELQAELEQISDFPALEQAHYERKAPAERALDDAQSEFHKYRIEKIPPGYRSQEIRDHPLIKMILVGDAEMTTAQYQQALVILAQWKEANADKADWGSRQSWAKARDQNRKFVMLRDRQFPGIFSVQSQYWEIRDQDKAAAKLFLAAHPELVEYWDARREFGSKNAAWAYYYLKPSVARAPYAEREYPDWPAWPRYGGYPRRAYEPRPSYTRYPPKAKLYPPSPWKGALRFPEYRATGTPQLFRRDWRTSRLPWLPVPYRKPMGRPWKPK